MAEPTPGPIGFGILPLRAVLYTLSNSSVWLIGVQLLDGVGAGVFGAITPLVVADLMRGTGRYNVAQGVVATAQGIGASASGLAAGLIVDHFGYSAALDLGRAVAAIAMLAVAMPETVPSPDVAPSASWRRPAVRAGRPTDRPQSDRRRPRASSRARRRCRVRPHRRRHRAGGDHRRSLPRRRPIGLGRRRDRVDPVRAAAMLILPPPTRHRHRQLAGILPRPRRAALLGASLMVALGMLPSTRRYARSTSTRSRCCSA